MTLIELDRAPTATVISPAVGLPQMACLIAALYLV